MNATGSINTTSRPCTPSARAYVPQTPESLISYIAERSVIRRHLGGGPEGWRVREVGDGNLNLVFIVNGRAGSVVVKQAVPYLRCVGESWPLTLERIRFEYEALVEEARHAPMRVPAVYHFDHTLELIVMEHLTPHIILRKGLIQGVDYPLLAKHIGEFLAESLFKTSDYYVSSAKKKERVALFCANTQLCKLTEDLVFTDPYHCAPLNRHTTPQLDDVVQSFRGDGRLKFAAQELKYAFVTHAEAMIHGDLHTGSVMVTATDTRVIDPEFAFYGPMGFDVGAFIGNLLLAWCSQPGHARKPGERTEYGRWLLSQVKDVWDFFSYRFSVLWRERKSRVDGGDAFTSELFEDQPGADDEVLGNILRHIWQDTVGFAGVKMIRRILGLAHVEDLESIANPDLRAACERQALQLGRRMVTERADCSSVKALLAMVEEERHECGSRLQC